MKKLICQGSLIINKIKKYVINTTNLNYFNPYFIWQKNKGDMKDKSPGKLIQR